jgi:hypothetical protein
MRWLPTIIIAMTLVAANPVLGRQDEQAEVKAWFIALLDDAKSHFKARSMKIEWNREALEEPSRQEVEAIRERVKNFPEHPDRSKLGELEARQRNGPQSWRETVWLRNGDFRSSAQSGRPNDPFYIDTVRVGKSGWKLNPGELYLVGPSETAPPGHDLEQQYLSSITNILPLFGAGLDWFGPWEAQSSLESLGNKKWIARTRYGSDEIKTTTTITIEWDNVRKTGRCVEAAITSRGSLNLDQRIVSNNWIVPPFGGNEIAQEVVSEQGGKPVLRITLLSIDVLNEQEFSLLTKQPEISDSDPIRGKVTFTQIQDFTGTSPLFTIKDDSGIRTLTYGQTPEGQRRSTVKVIGWITAGMIVVTLLLLRVRASVTRRTVKGVFHAKES